MANPTAIKDYEVEYAGNVLLDERGAAIIRFESTAHERVAVLMGRRLLERLHRDLEAVLSKTLL